MQTAFINGKIYTVNHNQPWVEAILVKDNIIQKIGTNAEILSMDFSELVDLNQKLVLPGFIDAHTHVFMGDIMSRGIQFELSTTKEELLDIIKNHTESDLILGVGFSANIHGTAEDLDSIIPDKPVVLFDEGCHAMWVNSKTLQLANITKDTKDPIPGSDYYERDESGNLTGWVVESNAMRPIVKKLQLLEKVIESNPMFEIFAEHGITSVFNASEFYFSDNSTAPCEYLDKLAQQNKSMLRFCTSYSYNNHESDQDPVETLKTQNKIFNSDYVKIDTLKIWLDGTVEAQTANLSTPYQGSTHAGGMFYPEEELQQAINKATSYGFNVHLHAIGDKTIDTALKLCKTAKSLYPDYKGTHTIAHNEVFNQNTVSNYKDSGIIANTTPVWHVYTDIAVELLGGERFQNTFAFNSLIKNGVLTTFGSDYPAGLGLLAMNVFYNIQAGHTRTFPNQTEALPTPDECLSLEDLIKGYTINAAVQLSMQDKIGSIEEGKYADFIVLRHNLWTQNTNDIHKNHVVMTVFDGKIIYKK